jgi:hypothetical protein
MGEEEVGAKRNADEKRGVVLRFRKAEAGI